MEQEGEKTETREKREGTQVSSEEISFPFLCFSFLCFSFFFLFFSVSLYFCFFLTRTFFLLLFAFTYLNFFYFLPADSIPSVRDQRIQSPLSGKCFKKSSHVISCFGCPVALSLFCETHSPFSTSYLVI
jgi:hypothetical protein